MKYGRWTVPDDATGRVEARCDCGSVKVVRVGDLRSGKSASCGCYRREALRRLRTTHGGYGTGAYSAWSHAKGRTTNPRNKKWPRYGGRGIRMCQRWRDSFQAFLDDMGERPGPGYSIERVDNDGDYEPGNCKWARRSDQANNTSANRVLEYGGEIMTLAQWAERIGIKYHTLHGRLRRGWSVERTLTTPLSA